MLIEPQVDVFQEGLTKTYEGNPRVILENVALSNTEGELPFYRVAVSKQRWATGLSSFNKKSLLDHIENGYIVRGAREEGVEIPDDPEKLLEVVHVRTTTVETLFHKHHISKIDVLCVDTEGYDSEILKLIDFWRYSPDIVLFESKNLSNRDFTDAKKLLLRAGYTLYWERGDTVGVKMSLPFLLKVKLMAKAWKRKI